MRWLLRLVVASMCFGLPAAGAVAQAPNPAGESADYRSIVQQALTEYDAGRYPEARALFLHAHELQPSARTLRCLGMVEFELRHYVEAIHLLEQSLTDARKPLTDTQKQDATKLLHQATSFVGRYHVATEPGTVALRVDGSPVVLDARKLLVLDVGDHTVTARAPHYRDQARQLDVRGGEQEELRFELEAENVPAVASVAAPSAPASDSAATDAKPKRPLLLRQTTWGFIAGGAAVLALGGAVVAWQVEESAADRWNDDSKCLADGKTRKQNCAADHDSAHTATIWATVGLIAAGALGITSALLLSTARSGDDRAPERAARCGAGPGEIGVGCVVSF